MRSDSYAYSGFSFDEDAILDSYIKGKSESAYSNSPSRFTQNSADILLSGFSLNSVLTPKVVFAVDKIWFGIDVDCFDEFFEAKPIQFVREDESCLLVGLVSYKGKAVKCFSSRKLLLTDKDDSRSKYMAAFTIRGETFIMEIDDVCGLKRVDMYRGLSGFKKGFPESTVSTIVNCDDKQVAVLDTNVLYIKIMDYMVA